MTAITRRKALATVPAIAAVAVLPSEAATGDEALLELEREYLQLVDYNNNLDCGDEEGDYLAGRANDIAYTIFDTPSRSTVGIAVKLRMHCELQCWTLDEDWTPTAGEYSNLDDGPVISALADAERLAGGAL